MALVRARGKGLCFSLVRVYFPIYAISLRKLRVRYNHSERKNHTKFFAKLFSHWLKTLFSGFTPSFKEKEVHHHFYYVFLWQQRKEKDYLLPRHT